jgi:hypothetical protein
MNTNIIGRGWLSKIILIRLTIIQKLLSLDEVRAPSRKLVIRQEVAREEGTTIRLPTGFDDGKQSKQ